MRRFESYGVGIPNLDLAELTGWLIVVEGTDGVGRSTQIEQLVPWLEIEGYAVAQTGWTRSPLLSDTIDEAKALIENGFEYVTDFQDTKLFRKRK